MNIKKLLLVGLATVCVYSPSWAVDSMSIDIGSGNRSQIYRVDGRWDTDQNVWESQGSKVELYGEISGAYWNENAYLYKVGDHQSLMDIGITPVLRWEKNSKLGYYGEVGIGGHVMSHIYKNNSREFSTAFQFGDFVGIGYVFSCKWDMGLELEHFSNAKIKEPNPGVNMLLVKLSYHF